MKSGLRAWVRLALILSGLWLLGISLFALFSWRDPDRIPSPFVETARYAFHWFDWGLFAMSAFGGVAAIWLLAVGVPWVVQSFREPGHG